MVTQEESIEIIQAAKYRNQQRWQTSPTAELIIISIITITIIIIFTIQITNPNEESFRPKTRRPQQRRQSNKERKIIEEYENNNKNK